MILAKL